MRSIWGSVRDAAERPQMNESNRSQAWTPSRWLDHGRRGNTSRQGNGWWVVVGAVLALIYDSPSLGQAPLASGELRILGVQLVVSPAAQTVPKNQATGLDTALVDPSNPTASVTDPSLANLVVKGTLSGPAVGALDALPVGATR